jgi:hypothetical protein
MQEPTLDFAMETERIGHEKTFRPSRPDSTSKLEVLDREGLEGERRLLQIRLHVRRCDDDFFEHGGCDTLRLSVKRDRQTSRAELAKGRNGKPRHHRMRPVIAPPLPVHGCRERSDPSELFPQPSETRLL